MVIYAGLIFQVLYNAVCSVLRAVGDSVIPLLFTVVSAALNIVLDILFILLMPTTDLKVAGAALATIITQGVSALLCFIYALKKYPELRFRARDFRFDWTEIS